MGCCDGQNQFGMPNDGLLRSNPNRQSIVSSLQACTGLPEAKRIHANIVSMQCDRDLFISNHLVNMYARCHALEDARSVFDKLRERNIVSWNAMITAYSQDGLWRKGLELFWEMEKQDTVPNRITFLSILRAFSTPEALAEGKLVHSCISNSGLKSDVGVGNALISMYDRCGAVEDARDVFDNMHQRDIVSWTAIMEAYSHHGLGKEAFDLYAEMQMHGITPDRVSFVSIIGACADTSAISEGKSIHAHLVVCGFEDDVMIRNALVYMYGRCGELQDARVLFEKSRHRTVVSWNAMISALSQHEHSKESLNIFRKMQQGFVKPTLITFTGLLSACASPISLAEGKAIHACIVDHGFDSDVIVGSALLSMYGKCGDLEDACLMFDYMDIRNVCSWNAMLMAHSQHGNGVEALELFRQMEEQGVEPNEVTFVALLSACAHSGLVCEGQNFYVSMRQRHEITPILEHHSCMIDLLGRAGRLDEAENMIYKMPLEADLPVWTSLLRACKIHGDITRGERAAEHLFELDPENDAAFLLLSNLYGTYGM